MTRGTPVSMNGVEMTYGEGAEAVHALGGIDLDVAAGEFLCVTGPSGSGKSTLLHIVAGLQQPTAGHVFVGETEVSALSTHQTEDFRCRHVGLIFQSLNLLGSLSVRQNAALPLLISGVSMRAARPMVDPVLDRLSLLDRVDHRISELSGGQLQRVAIARALAGNASVILADEPTGNLDEANGHVVLRELRRACKDQGLTVILVTHDPSAEGYADRSLVMDDGRLRGH